MAVFIIVFALAGALFFGLKYWGRQMQAKAALVAEDGDGLGDRLEANVDNLEFAADLIGRAARRGRGDDSSGDAGGSDGGGGDGGGGDGGG